MFSASEVSRRMLMRLLCSIMHAPTTKGASYRGVSLVTWMRSKAGHFTTGMLVSKESMRRLSTVGTASILKRYGDRCARSLRRKAAKSAEPLRNTRCLSYTPSVALQRR